jgi:hypothetical protein
MKVQYRITEDDYAYLARFHAWRHFIARPPIWQSIAGVLLVPVIAFGLWTFPGAIYFLAFAIALFAVLFALTLFVLIPNRARRYYQQYKGIQEPVTAELLEAGIRFANADGEGILSWPKVFQWRQNDRFILIYAMPVIYYILPKAIGREGFDIQGVVQRLVEHVGPER